MLNTSTAYDTAVTAGTRFERVTGTVTLPDTTVINIADSDIVGSSLYIDESIMPGNDFSIGAVIASEMGVKLKIPGNNINGAVIKLDYQIAIPEDVPEIGSSYGGGKVAYILQPGDSGYDADYIKGLVIDTTNRVGVWSSDSTQSIATSDLVGTGAANTNAVDVYDTSGAHYAANLYTDGTYSDWYIPSKGDWDKVVANKVAIGGFVDELYWASSQSSATQAYGIWFLYDSWGTYAKTDNRYVRYMRTFSIPKWSDKVPLGIYNVVTSKRNNDYIDIKALDNIIKFDTRTYTADGLSMGFYNMTTFLSYIDDVISPYSITNTAYELYGYANDNGVVMAEIDDTLTAREVLQYSAVMTGSYYKAERDGNVKRHQYYNPIISKTILASQRYPGTKVEEGVIAINRISIQKGQVIHKNSASTKNGIGFGHANTDMIIAQNTAGNTYAAGLASAYAGGGFSDWYLPSYHELMELRHALASTSGDRTTYGFNTSEYWCSSEFNTTDAFNVRFSDGLTSFMTKSATYRVRAIRNYTDTTPRAIGYDTGNGYIFYRFGDTNDYLECAKTDNSSGIIWSKVAFQSTRLPIATAMTMELKGNPFIESQESTPFPMLNYTLREIINNIYNVEYRPFQTDIKGDPSIESGDWIILNDYNGENVRTLVTNSHWRYRGKHTISGVGNTNVLIKPITQYEKDLSDVKATLIPSDFTDATYENSWSSYDATSYNVAGYRRAGTTVSLRGLVKKATAGVVGEAIFTLPTGFRPLKTLIINTVANNAFAVIRVNSAGGVTFGAGSNAWLSLEGISFELE